MILEKIKNFDWYNEPKNVRFIEEGILIETCSNTDFWQCKDSNFSIDNGHLFIKEYEGNFIITVKWSFFKIKDSAQCGIIARFNEYNWIKFGLLSPNPYNPQIGVVVANDGACDWSINNLPKEQKSIWLKLRRKGNDFVVFYSLDGITFEQIRLVHFSNSSNFIKIGAYACSPKDESFECVLEDLDISSS